MKRIVSGITPSGKVTIGNYIGAIKNFIKLQKDNELFIFVANLHAITSQKITNQQLKENTKLLFRTYIACGIDPEKIVLYLQSDVKSQAQLGHILLCHTSMGELSRMTQFKDKGGNDTYIPTGLFTYPTLMAADILSFNPDLVPVGADQKQHLELTRDIAERINNKYGEIFKIPEPYINKIGNRIMSLQNPDKKMSKSDVNTNNFITLDEDINLAKKKIMSAFTDNENIVKFDPLTKPGVSNLMIIYSELSGISLESIEKKYYGIKYPYNIFKEDLANIIADLLKNIQSDIKAISNDELKYLMQKGAKKAKLIADKTLTKVERAIGVKVFR